MSVTRNAKIEKTQLGYEGHGMLTAWLFIDYGNSGQGFGVYAFDTDSGQDGSGFAGWFVNRVLNTLGVDSWEDLPGTPCRVEHQNDKVIRIGHFLDDRWFDPSEFKS